jgi:dienelactone hydrolase
LASLTVASFAPRLSLANLLLCCGSGGILPNVVSNLPGRARNDVMAEILLFHHAQGQTPGFLAFADELRAAGHAVHTPDLYDGKTFAALDEGVGYAQQVGFDTILERGRLSAESLPNELVYGGFSLGVMPAQLLAQTRPGTKGALFFSAALPASEFGGSWPQGVPLQIHMMEADEWALEDLDAARELETNDGAELFLYPGDRHLFADNSLPDYDEGAATLLKQRALAFLDNIE